MEQAKVDHACDVQSTILTVAAARTGTLSLKRALEILGFGPCYHMEEMGQKGVPHFDFWIEILAQRERGLPLDADAVREFLESYNSGLDFPICALYREMMNIYPEAKVILTVRSPESWYKSCMESIHALTYDWSMRFLVWLLPSVRKFNKVAARYFEQEPFFGMID